MVIYTIAIISVNGVKYYYLWYVYSNEWFENRLKITFGSQKKKEEEETASCVAW